MPDNLDLSGKLDGLGDTIGGFRRALGFTLTEVPPHWTPEQVEAAKDQIRQGIEDFNAWRADADR